MLGMEISIVRSLSLSLRNFELTGTVIMLYNDKQRQQAEHLVHRMVKTAVEMEGTVTGEHGVGLVKRDYLDHELGVTTVDAMRKVCSLTLYPYEIIYADHFVAENGFRSTMPTEPRQSCQSTETEAGRSIRVVS